MDSSDIRVINIVATKMLDEELKTEKILSEMGKSVGEDEEPKHFEYYEYLNKLTHTIRSGIIDVLDGNLSHDDFVIKINSILERWSENVE